MKKYELQIYIIITTLALIYDLDMNFIQSISLTAFIGFVYYSKNIERRVRE